MSDNASDDAFMWAWMVPAASRRLVPRLALVAGLPDANWMRARFGVVLPEIDCSVLVAGQAECQHPTAFVSSEVNEDGCVRLLTTALGDRIAQLCPPIGVFNY